MSVEKTHLCERCKERTVAEKYRFCWECREATAEEERIRDAILIRACATMAASLPAMPSKDVALRAFEIANAAVGIRKARS